MKITKYSRSPITKKAESVPECNVIQIARM